MKKLKFDGKEMLSKDQMRNVNGGYTGDNLCGAYLVCQIVDGGWSNSGETHTISGYLNCADFEDNTITCNAAYGQYGFHPWRVLSCTCNY